MRRLSLVAGFALALLSPVDGAQTSAASGLIFGRVIDAVTGAPISGAQVSTRSPEAQLTDADGHFVFFDLPPGSFHLLVIKDGYVNGGYGLNWTGTAQIFNEAMGSGRSTELVSLASGERRQVTLKLWPVAAISGQVTDETGEPVVGVQVHAYPRTWAGGRPWINTALPFVGRTDDLGRYRIHGLVAGDYVVAVPAVSLAAKFEADSRSWWSTLPSAAVALLADRRSGFDIPERDDPRARDWSVGVPNGPSLAPTPDGPRGYRTTFAPSSSSASGAFVVTIGAGANRMGVDIALASHPVRAVSGMVTGPFGPVANTAVRLLDAGDAISQAPSAIGVTDTDGRFLLTNVAEGHYQLVAESMPRVAGYTVTGWQPRRGGATIWYDKVDPWTDRPALAGALPIDVGDHDLRDVVLTVSPGARIRGRVELDERLDQSEVRLAQQDLRIERADGRADSIVFGQVGIDPTGRFQTAGLPPGRYLLRSRTPEITGPSEWSVASARWRDIDLSVTAIEVGTDDIDDVVVTLTRHPRVLEGTVSGDGATESVVVVFPTDPRHWVDYGQRPRTIKETAPDDRGTFRIRDLADGEYFAAAVDGRQMSRFPAPEFLRALTAQATKVVVSAEPSQPLRLSVITVIR